MLAWILFEPTFVRTVKRQFDRQVAVLWDDSASMDLTDDGAADSRAVIARDAVDNSGILKQLGEHVRLREFRFARSPEADANDHADGWNQATDIAAALDTVLEQIPPDELAGALVLTDGRHNRPSRVEDSARRFGILDAPLGIVAIGSPDPPRDAAVLAVRSPDAIHLGERMRVAADLKFDGYKGQQAKVQPDLRRQADRGKGHLRSRRTATARRSSSSTSPNKAAPAAIRSRSARSNGERFPDNNAWSFETSITEARTNVLLVDSYPRWEFRYLRNLFYGRDKSVHLQWLLLHPDQARGPIAARRRRLRRPALRPSRRQPLAGKRSRMAQVRRHHPRRPPARGHPRRHLVDHFPLRQRARRPAGLRRRAQPHAPCARRRRRPRIAAGRCRLGPPSLFGDPANRSGFSLTAEGRRHPVTRHATGTIANEQIWSGFPALQWRHPVTSVKDGAEILLTAADEDCRRLRRRPRCRRRPGYRAR